jgi:hypothetical protein
MSRCKEGNPKVTEEYCTDIAYHDIAITERDISLCEKIKNEGIKEHCVRSL